MGFLRGPLRVAIDTTPILGRGAVKDTYNLLADGIRQVGTVLAGLEGISPELWGQQNDFRRYWEASSLKGDAGIDWSDEEQRKVFLNGLVADVQRVLLVAKKCADAADEATARKLSEACSLLQRLVSQDTEPDPNPPKGLPARPTEETGSAGESSEPKKEVLEDAPPIDAQEESIREADCSEEDGQPSESESPCETHLLQEMVRIRQKVAADRVISVYDPEMRHGRKSASNRFDGHKLATTVDTGSGLFLSLDILPGNAGDNEGALELTLQAQDNSGVPVTEVVGDCAFGDGGTRKSFKETGIDLRAKCPATPAGDPFHKNHFAFDLTNRIATCPAGHMTTELNHIKHRRGVTEQFLFRAEVCSKCPHAEQCLRAVDRRRGRGRSVVLHPQEELLQEARLHQTTPAFREDVKARQVVEHRLGRLVQLDVRQARYAGRRKTRFQALMIAMVANLTLLSGAAFLPFLAFTGTLWGRQDAASAIGTRLRKFEHPSPRNASTARWSPDGRSWPSKNGGLRLAS
jgi:hypothetical protein